MKMFVSTIHWNVDRPGPKQYTVTVAYTDFDCLIMNLSKTVRRNLILLGTYATADGILLTTAMKSLHFIRKIKRFVLN